MSSIRHKVTVVLLSIIFPSVSNRAQCVGRNAPGLIDRGTHQTVSITYH